MVIRCEVPITTYQIQTTLLIGIQLMTFGISKSLQRSLWWCGVFSETDFRLKTTWVVRVSLHRQIWLVQQDVTQQKQLLIYFCIAPSPLTAGLRCGIGLVSHQCYQVIFDITLFSSSRWRQFLTFHTISFHIIWFATVWMIWKDRNNRVFQNPVSTPLMPIEKIHQLSFLWLKSKQVNFDYIYHDSCNQPLLCIGVRM